MALDDLLDTGKGKLTEWNEGRKKRSSEVSITFTPRTGKKSITSSLSSTVTIYQQKDGLVYFNKNDNILYELCEYNWEGPEYRTVVNTVTKGQEKGKSKRTGRIIGAVVGTAILPGVGTVIGAAHGSGNKKNKKNISTHSKTYEDKEELTTIASIKVRNIQTNEYSEITFNCDSRINALFSQLQVSNQNIKNQIEFEEIPVNEANSETIENNNEIDPYEEVKKLKELLDMEIISQEEFDSKKKELLGL
jgi:hypothetical protein